MKAVSKYLIWLLHGVFFALFALAIIHYKERLFADSAYFFFHSVNSEWFHIEHNRLLLGFSQLIPVIGSWLGLPLKYLLLSYSLGVELIYYLLFLFLLYKLKDKAGAIALVLTHLIGQLWLFHVPSLEICHGAALTVVFYSILKSGRAAKDDKWIILLLLVEWLILFAHPANLLFLPFVILLDIVNRNWQKKVHYNSIGFFLIALAVRFSTMSSYDASHLNEGTKSSQAISIFNADYWDGVFDVLLSYYPALLVLILATLGFLIMKGNFKRVILFLGATAGILFCVAWLKPIDNFYFYTEAILTVFVGAAVFFFGYEFWNRLNQKWQSLLLIGVVIIAFGRLYWIEDFGQKFEQRKEQLDRLVDYSQGTYKGKLIISDENFGKRYSMMNWANPIEALIFSAIDGKEGSVSIISISDLDFENNRQELNDSSYMLRRFDILPISSLNEDYFVLPNHSYYPLNTNTTVDFNQLKKNVFIALGDSLRFPKAELVKTNIRIGNQADQVVSSAKESNVFIACHWYKEDGSSYKWDGYRSLLEVDVKGNYKQEISIETPSKAGTYFLQPDIVVEGQLWFELKPKVKVEVY